MRAALHPPPSACYASSRSLSPDWHSRPPITTLPLPPTALPEFVDTYKKKVSSKSTHGPGKSAGLKGGRRISFKEYGNSANLLKVTLAACFIFSPRWHQSYTYISNKINIMNKCNRAMGAIRVTEDWVEVVMTRSHRRGGLLVAWRAKTPPRDRREWSEIGSSVRSTENEDDSESDEWTSIWRNASERSIEVM